MATPRKLPFELTGADGGPIRGDIRTAGMGDARPAVVVCHGFTGFKDWGFFPHLTQRLALAGMTAVSFNFSGSGIGPDGETLSEPERFGHNTLSREIEDLTTVWRALSRGDLVAGLVPPMRTGLFGHSRGGGIATLFAGNRQVPDVSALVTWAAIATMADDSPRVIRQWRKRGKREIVDARTGVILPMYLDGLNDLEQNPERLDIPAAASRVQAPWLIVHGAKDRAVPVAHAHRLVKACVSTGPELMILSHATHTFGAKHPFGGPTEELDSALDATTAFFVWHLL